MIDWNIQSRAHACEACGHGFSDKETYHTLLFDERAAFRRIDVCQNCWQTQYSEGARERKGFVSYWHGVYEAPTPQPEPIRKETAESLLRKIIELNDRQYIPAAYILAVMLERKRVLKVKEQVVRDEGRVFIYEHPKTGEVFTITDPNLQLNQLETVQHDVAALLEHGLGGTMPSASPGLAARESAGEETANMAAPSAGAGESSGV